MNWYLFKLNDMGQVEKIFDGPFDSEDIAINTLNEFHKIKNVAPGYIHIVLPGSPQVQYLPTQLTHWQWKQIVDEGQLFGKPSAIKMYKDFTRDTLMNSKRAVEHYFETYGFKFT